VKRWTLREARLERGLTQEQLAAKTGIRQSAISRLELGRIADPGFSIVLRLAQALDLRCEELVFDLQEEQGAA
jgi:transcriptional regulator with XRE-family HTH domain